MHRIAVSIFFFISGLTFASWASRIPDIKEKLQLTEAGLGSVLFALPVGLMCSLPLSGWLVSKFGSRRIVISAAFVYPLFLLLLALASTTFQLVVGLFFFGFVPQYCDEHAGRGSGSVIWKIHYGIIPWFMEFSTIHRGYNRNFLFVGRHYSIHTFCNDMDCDCLLSAAVI